MRKKMKRKAIKITAAGIGAVLVLAFLSACPIESEYLERIQEQLLLEMGIGTEPAAPMDLQAEGVSAEQIDLSWTDASDNETEFQIQRSSGDSSEWEAAGSVETDTSSFSDTNLAAETEYAYRVRAVSADGESEWTEEVSARTLAPAGITISPSIGQISGDKFTFIDMWENESTAPVTFTISNNGDEELILSDVNKTGDTLNFAVDSSGMSAVVAPGENTSFTIRFTPQSTGVKSMDLEIESSNSENMSIDLQGEGLLNVNVPNYVPEAACLDNSGNIFVTGWMNGTTYDWFVKKYDSDGNEILAGWDKQIDGNNGEDRAYDIFVDSGNNVHVVGEAEDMIPGGNAQSDWRQMKFDVNGTTVWDKSFTSTYDWLDKATAIAELGTDIYVGGWQGDPGPDPNVYYWWIKEFNNNTGSEDTTHWNKKIALATYSSEAIFDMLIYDDSDWEDRRIIVCGENNDDFFLQGYDIHGILKWEHSFDNALREDRALAMALNGAYFYVVGYGTDADDSWITHWWIKQFRCTDGSEYTNGWNKQLIRAGDPDYSVRDGAYDKAFAVAVGKANNVYVGGFECLEYNFQEYNWYLKKFSPTGEELDLGGTWMYTDDSQTETRVVTINGKDLAFDNVYTSHGYEHIVDILIDDLTDMVYLVGRSDDGFSIRAMHDE